MDSAGSTNQRISEGEFATDRGIDRRRTGRGVIPEGTDGLFSQTWWPICRAAEVGAGQVVGANFLDGRVAVYRPAEGGEPRVVSAYCPHNGADLSIGDVVDDQLRCRFHRWRFNSTGVCVATGCGDPPPPRARVFAYPTQERYGLIWAFNGETPLFELPDLGYPDEELQFHTDIPHLDINADPWVFMCNTLDFNHIRCVHGLVFDGADPDSEIEWAPHQVSYDLRGRFEATQAPVDYRVAIHGTNIFWQTGKANGKWFGFLFPCGLHRPGTMRAYYVIATRREDGPGGESLVHDTLKFAMELERMVVEQDLEILNTIRFTRGAYTRADRTLGRFVDHIMAHPRAHPGSEFIK